MDSTAPASDATRVVLIGMMGSGKSSVGRALATRTGWPFVDNDQLVERATGRTARELLATSGEAELRRAESQALEAALEIPTPAIVAVAAGTILRREHRARLAEAGLVVWLHAPAGVLAQRSGASDHRPWLDGDAEAWFVTTIASRDRLYASVADLAIDTASLSSAEAADRIVDALASG